MHTNWLRANAVFFFGVTVLCVMCAVAYVTDLVVEQPPPVFGDLKVKKLHRFMSYRNQDVALVTFDLDYDLRNAFLWTTKGMFIYVTAEFETKRYPFNQVVVHDRIVLDREDAKFDGSSIQIEYPISDAGSELRKKKVNLTLSWDVMPLFGPMYRETKVFKDQEFEMPSSYTD